MGYTPYDDVNPLSSQTGIALPVTINANEDALRDGEIGLGGTGGWTGSVVTGSGTAAEPQYIVLSNGALRIRATITWTAGYPTSLLLENSTNSGSTPNSTGTWSTMWTTTGTFDGSGNTTGGNNQTMISMVVFAIIGQLKALSARVDNIDGSLYDPTAVAITGGTLAGVGIATSTLNSTIIGATTPALGAFLSAREKHTSVAFGGATTTLDLDTAGSFDFTATSSGAATLTFSHFPASGILVTARIEIVNGGLRTWTYTNGKWGAGAPPTLSSSGTDVIFMQSRNGGTTRFFSLQDKGFA